jgi:hypothetical protein
VLRIIAPGGRHAIGVSMTEKKKMKPMMILKTYFEMDLQTAKKELKELTAAERDELAQLAAVELGVEVA